MTCFLRSALCLFIPWIFLEKPKMDAHGTWNLQPLILTLNSLCTFALNLSVFLVISHTSALTIRVAGVVKDWVVVLLSALLFADTKLTVINLLGYGIGKSAYHYFIYVWLGLFCFLLFQDWLFCLRICIRIMPYPMLAHGLISLHRVHSCFCSHYWCSCLQ